MIRTHGVVVASFLAVGCSHALPAPVPVSRPPSGNDFCYMAAAALHQVVRSHEKQPFGLEEACVKTRATRGEKIYVDARFSGANGFITIPQRSCTAGRYVIRFDHRQFEPSPSSEVVLLLVSEETANGRPFNARMETSDWPKKPPGTMALSQCGSAFGTLRRFGSGWTATISAPSGAANPSSTP
jgi:hypothetical protein